ncbi:MAG: methionyl-tRNA formyltransferase [Rhodoglobus sp.]
MRLVFTGSPAAAVPSLRALAESRHEILSVITRADSPQGRRGVLTATPVADEAELFGLPVIKSNRLAGETTEAIDALAPDLGVIVAYGGLVREPLLSLPRLGWINLHFSLLPRWRGAAPVQRAIMAGDDITGASVFQLVEELDAGAVYGRVTEAVGRHQTAGNLLDSLAESGAQLLARVVDALDEGTARAEPQTGEVTLAPKLALEDGEVLWDLAADAVSAQIRGVTPEPGAHTTVDGGRLKILEAAIARDVPRLPAGQFALSGRRVVVGTATEPIELLVVHPAGRKAMDAASWWRGRPAS